MGDGRDPGVMFSLVAHIDQHTLYCNLSDPSLDVVISFLHKIGSNQTNAYADAEGGGGTAGHR